MTEEIMNVQYAVHQSSVRRAMGVAHVAAQQVALGGLLGSGCGMWVHAPRIVRSQRSS